jgi:hypothetical protein
MVDLLQWLDVDHISFLIDLVVHLPLVGIVALSFLLVLPQPLSLHRLVHRLEHILYTFQ